MNIEYITINALFAAVGLTGYALGLRSGLDLRRKDDEKRCREKPFAVAESAQQQREAAILRNIENYGTINPQEEIK